MDRPVLKLYDEDGKTLLDESEVRRDADYIIIVEMSGNCPIGTRKLSLEGRQ
jgi:hypothetical protein